MTYDKFKKRAINPVYTEEPAVYRVDIFRIVNPNGNKLAWVLSPDEDINTLLQSEEPTSLDESVSAPQYYPQYRVNKSESCIFPTLEDAIKFIQSGDLKQYNTEELYCKRVYELPFGRDVISDCCKREWIFDANGALIEQSVCSSLIEDLDKTEGRFWGRTQSSIRFKPGDIVEVLDRENAIVRLAIVVALFNDIDYCWKEYQKVADTCESEGVGAEDADDNYWLNASDDCYCVTYGDEGEFYYPYTTDVFAPRFPVPDELRHYVLECYRRIRSRHR